jgi:pimeloyl-ACP methyl ester carboxylesterase
MRAARMKIILLPGLDGTGQLFQWLLPHLDGFDVQVESLPQEGPQDYPHLTAVLAERLPKDEPFVLLAESFSSPIAVQLAQQNSNIQAVIFVAGFLSKPRRLSLRLAKRYLGKKQLLRPWVKWLSARWIFKKQASHDVLAAFYDCLHQLDNKILRARLASISRLKPHPIKLQQPCLYLRPHMDVLVTHNTLAEFVQTCPKLQVMGFDAPHFILQTQSQIAAQRIREFIQDKVSTPASID